MQTLEEYRDQLYREIHAAREAGDDREYLRLCDIVEPINSTLINMEIYS